MREISLNVPSGLVTDFRPWMVECAWKYLVLANSNDCNSGAIQAAISALSLEILLKSYNSEVSENEGLLNERYCFKKLSRNDRHNLEKLAEIIPKEILAYLFHESDLEEIKKCSLDFTTERYLYEKNARTWHSDSLSKISAKAIISTIALYKKLGCCDPFIIHFDVSTNYQRYVQAYL